MGKYNYKTNYEEAIKQGVSKEEYSREASKNCIQTWIANELAEANRLKRVELNYYLIVNGMTAKEVHEKVELEDKA